MVDFQLVVPLTLPCSQLRMALRYIMFIGHNHKLVGYVPSLCFIAVVTLLRGRICISPVLIAIPIWRTYTGIYRFNLSRGDDNRNRTCIFHLRTFPKWRTFCISANLVEVEPFYLITILLVFPSSQKVELWSLYLQFDWKGRRDSNSQTSDLEGPRSGQLNYYPRSPTVRQSAPPHI